MNNEDKILCVLTELTATVGTLITKVDGLEAGQAKLEAGQIDLAKAVNKLDSRQDALLDSVNDLRAGQIDMRHDIKVIVEQTQDLTEFEAETRKSLSELAGVTSVNSYDIASLRHKVS